MAYENYPQSDATTNNKVPQKKGIRNILTGALVLALLGTWGYIIYDKNNAKEALNKQDNIITNTALEKEQLQKELEDAAMRYDVLKTDNFKKDSTITNKDREIAEKRTKIQQLLSKANATKEELAQAKSLIQSLNGDIETYKTQVAELTAQKNKLTQDNELLTTEKATVTEERDRVRKNYDSSTQVIKQKEDVIKAGSTLHASNFNIVGINEKRNGREKTTSTAKKVDKLRISFDLDENLIAESGTKQIFVCLTAPDGTPVNVEALGSGTFQTKNGEEKPYTQKLEVNYTQNQRQTISFDWKQNSDFAKGNYKIEVYNNGYKVGEGYKNLKKGGLF